MKYILAILAVILSGCATVISPVGGLLVQRTRTGYYIRDQDRTCGVLLTDCGLNYAGVWVGDSQLFKKKLDESSDYHVSILITEANRMRSEEPILPSWWTEKLQTEVGGASDLYGKSFARIGDWDGVFVHLPYFYDFEGEHRYGGMIQQLLVKRRIGKKVIVIEQSLGYSGKYREEVGRTLVDLLKNIVIRITPRTANQALEPTPPAVMPCAPSSTSHASRGRGSSLTLGRADFTTKTMRPIYSAAQVGVSAFVGGPIAACWIMSQTFRSVGDHRKQKVWLWGGGVGTIALVCIVFVLPEHFPNSALPIGYTLGLYQMAKQQLRNIPDTEDLRSGSWWMAIGVSIVGLVLTMAAIFGVSFLMPTDA